MWPIVFVLLLGALPIRADDEARLAAPVVGYTDADLDGANDRFRDANGDGVDEVSGKAYRHRFGFVDADENGINDLFVDQDGDGVNDLGARFVDADKDGVCDNIIDYDGDGVNDITGIEYDRRSLRGFRFGRVDEERRKVHRRFVDEDGDGMNDLFRRFHPGPGHRPGMDHFIDEDGDGIADGRRLGPPTKRPVIERLRERSRGRPRPTKGARPGPRPPQGGKGGRR
ncbi:MAG: hypothetical protein GKR89_15625 [Candidatus Latescibacteria bacterium]|nr:hypothetical protein [Candidatus Latescibacterota bacterium]